MLKRKGFQVLLQRLKESRRFIQVLLGPRQVGKTTTARQVSEEIGRPVHFVSADLATLQSPNWLQQQWEVARSKIASGKGCILIIDEVQKIANWSETVKALWDADTLHGINLSVVLLGSSPWLMQKGLTESMAGRFEIIPITHWSFAEMQQHFKWTLEQYAYYGGYPGAAPLIADADATRWRSYITDSLIETTISRDILLLTQVNKPALLRRLFHLGCAYSSQILSYTKIIGQLQDAGNTTTLAHYLDLLSGVGMLTGLQKYSPSQVRQRGSIPKFNVFNTALMSAQAHKSFSQAREDSTFWGRIIESMVGAHLLNCVRGTAYQLFYWREGNNEVDFVLKFGNEIVGIEVKSGREKERYKSTETFIKQCKPKRFLLVGEGGIPLEDFLRSSLENIMGA
jgi:predicted AAA+ superfamily ATPase